MYGTTEEVFFTNWDFGGRIGIKTIPLLKNPIHSTLTLVEMEQTDFNHSREEISCTNRTRASVSSGQLRGIKADSYIFLKKTIGY
jgi:hypothetical protein